MLEPGMIRGTHHLTFCAGGAGEDYDFHVRLLGLRSIKKTVLFDGEIPIYHLYYANRIGDLSTIFNSFPYRQAAWMGKRGTNQPRTINVAVPADSIGYWADRLSTHGVAYEEAERFGTQRLDLAHRCGIPYSLSVRPSAMIASRATAGTCRSSTRSAAPTAPRPSVRDPGAMDDFLRRGMAAEHVSSEGPHHQCRIGTDEGGGRVLELVEEPDRAQGTWSFGEGTIHHHAFDAGTAENQAAAKDWIVRLGYTDVSDVKDRGYFHSVYLRTPGGALFELAYSTPQGFTLDEPEDELGTHMCIPPQWEDRRSEIAQLEPIDTVQHVVGAPGAV